MIFYGTSSKTIDHALMVNQVCPSCNRSSMVLTSIQCYGHIYWLPLLPTKRYYYLNCEACGATVESENLDDFGLEHVAGEFKTPKFCYMGWVIIGIIFLFSHFSGCSSDTSRNFNDNFITIQEIADLKKGDYILLSDIDEPGYMIFHVLDFDGENAIIEMSKFAYSKKRTAVKKINKQSTILKAGFFSEESYELPVEQIQQLFEVEYIIRARPKEEAALEQVVEES